MRPGFFAVVGEGRIVVFFIDLSIVGDGASALWIGFRA
jgi:hypothetical protein